MRASENERERVRVGEREGVSGERIGREEEAGELEKWAREEGEREGERREQRYKLLVLFFIPLSETCSAKPDPDYIQFESAQEKKKNLIF